MNVTFWRVVKAVFIIEFEPPLRRALCRAFGHRWVVEDRAEPVTVFNACIRCGKFTR